MNLLFNITVPGPPGWAPGTSRCTGRPGAPAALGVTSSAAAVSPQRCVRSGTRGPLGAPSAPPEQRPKPERRAAPPQPLPPGARSALSATSRHRVPAHISTASRQPANHPALPATAPTNKSAPRRAAPLRACFGAGG